MLERGINNPPSSYVGRSKSLEFQYEVGVQYLQSLEINLLKLSYKYQGYLLARTAAKGLVSNPYSPLSMLGVKKV